MAEDGNLATRLLMIVNNLERMRDEYPAIARHYPLWSQQRKWTIDAINQFQKKLNAVHKSSKVVSVSRSKVGSLSSLIGSICTVVGAILTLRGSSSSQSLLNVGSNLKTAGDITVPVTALFEWGISLKFMNDFKAVLERDKTSSQPMLQSLEYSRRLDETISEMFGCSIYSDIWQDVLSAWNQSLQHMDDVITESRDIADILRARLEGKVTDDVLRTIIRSFWRFSRQIAGSAGRGAMVTLQRVCELTKCPHVQMGIESVKLFTHVKGLVNINQCSPSSSLNKPSLEQCSTNMIQQQCLGEALSMASDIINLINSRDGYLDGVSNYSKRMEVIKNNLQRELDNMVNFILLFEDGDND